MKRKVKTTIIVLHSYVNQNKIAYRPTHWLGIQVGKIVEKQKYILSN